MSLFDITASNIYIDYPLMSYTNKTMSLPKALVQGEAEINHRLLDIVQFNGLVAKEQGSIIDMYV